MQPLSSQDSGLHRLVTLFFKKKNFIKFINLLYIVFFQLDDWICSIMVKRAPDLNKDF